MARLRNPNGPGHASHGGVAYTADEEGAIEVPTHVAEVLMARHGFEPAPAARPRPKVPPVKAAEKEIRN